ncbi:MAG: OsmC family peroxiredoxin [Dehalococcoidia bacterium]|nr:OsmC family peroxiredoxin [Dehalococcoidia bacterium]
MTSSRPKSFTFTTGVTWSQGAEGVLTSPGRPDIKISTPPEFRGPEGNWAPEHLYIAAIESCLLFTFLARARSKQLQFSAYRSTAEGLLEPVYGKHVVSKVTVKPRLTVPNEEEAQKARELFAEVEEHCFISNSVESVVVLAAEVTVG